MAEKKPPSDAPAELLEEKSEPPRQDDDHDRELVRFSYQNAATVGLRR